jgi:hypothetical protein
MTGPGARGGGRRSWHDRQRQSAGASRLVLRGVVRRVRVLGVRPAAVSGGVADSVRMGFNAETPGDWVARGFVWLRRLVNGMGWVNAPYVSRLGGPDKRGYPWPFHSAYPQATA